ncbi:MAG: PH domain-containing protein [Lysinibacillus sp.]
MTFLPKFDRSFKDYMMTVMLFCAACFFMPFVISSFDLTLLLFMAGLYVVVIGIFLWTMFSTRYRFCHTYLHLTGGPIRIKIPYKKISHVTRTFEIRAGFHLMTSKDGLVIHYKSAVLREFKISPAKQQDFLQELVRHAPQTQLDI